MPRPKSDRSRIPISLLKKNRAKLERIAEARGGLALSTTIEQLVVEEYEKKFKDVSLENNKNGGTTLTEPLGRAVGNE